MRRRLLAGGLISLLVALLSIQGATAASAATGTYLRLAHLSPDTPTIDVVVTSFTGETLRLDGVGYGDVSTYQEIEPGSYTLQMRLAGSPESTPPVVTGLLEAQEGAAYTAAGLGLRSDLAVRVLVDDLTPPGPGQSRVRVVQGAEQAGDVQVGWAGALAFEDVPFGTATDYVTVAAGDAAFDVTPASGPATGLPVRLDPGVVYSLVLVQADGQLTARLRSDAVGAAQPPAGGIDTGLGGSAPNGWAPRAAVLALAGLVAVAGVRGRRQHR